MDSELAAPRAMDARCCRRDAERAGYVSFPDQGNRSSEGYLSVSSPGMANAVDEGSAREQSFPVRARLSTPTDFHRVFSRPRRMFGAGYTLLIRVNDLGRPRLGLAISKRRASRAAQRNRLKRIARESFRRASADLPPVDIIAQCSRGATELSNKRLHDTLVQAWASIRKMRWDA